MIRIVNTNNSVKNNHDEKWRAANIHPSIDGDMSCYTPQSDVDAIAASMDEPQTQNDKLCDNVNQPRLLPNNIKNSDMQSMVDNYIRQNGGIPQNNNIKRNQTLLG